MREIEKDELWEDTRQMERLGNCKKCFHLTSIRIQWPNMQPNWVSAVATAQHCINVRSRVTWGALLHLTMEAAVSSEMLVPFCQTTWCHTPQD
jgi:hypothetical protein